MNHFSPSLYIVFCIANNGCSGGSNSCMPRDGGGKKGQASLFVAQEIVESSATTDFQMCHLSWHLSYERKALPEREKERVRAKGGKKIIIGVFLSFSIISLHKLCQQNQNAPFLESQGRAPLGRAKGSRRDRRHPDKK